VLTNHLAGKWPDRTKLAHDGLQVSVHPRCAQGQGQGQRSRDTGTFVVARKSLLEDVTDMTGVSSPNLLHTDTHHVTTIHTRSQAYILWTALIDS